MRRSATLIPLALLLGPLACLSAPAAAASRPVAVTFIGDSVLASTRHDEQAQELLTRGLSARLELAVCRRLVTKSCAYRGRRPRSALAVVRDRGERLGQALVVGVGYNDVSRGFGADIDRLMRAAKGRGVKTVVFVTLRQSRPRYRAINRQIRAAKLRHPTLVVADWHAHCRGRQRWIASDGLHLSPAGARALAAFLRPFAVRAARAR